MMKLRFPEKAVEMMVVANVIPPERQLTCESRDIGCRAIAEKAFRDVAADVGYTFASESGMPRLPSDAPSSSSTGRHAAGQKESAPWSFSRTVQSPADEQDFLSRCDEEGRKFFAVMFEAQKTASGQTKITWAHQSGFSMQFYFHRIGFAPIVWGFPAKNREGKSIRQRLDFPFDFSVKAGVPEAFVEEIGTALSSLVPFSGGRKRPSIPITALQSGETTKIIEAIFSFANKASKK